MDTLAETRASNVSIKLLRDPTAAQRTAWVFMADGRPVWAVHSSAGQSGNNAGGLTARAIARTREFIADQKERSGLGTEYHLALAKLTGADAKGRGSPVTQEDIDRLMEAHRNHHPRPKGWKVDQAYTTCEHQTNVYGLQITEMTLLDRESESWAVTVEPVATGTMGGERWLRFDKNHQGVSCEYGR